MRKSSVLAYLRLMLEDYFKGDMDMISEVYIKYQNMYDGIDEEDAHSALEILRFIIVQEFESGHPKIEHPEFDEAFELAMINNGHHKIWAD